MTSNEISFPLSSQSPNDDSGIDISVIVAFHNMEEHLPKCLESLRNQTLETAEFIVIDCGSTDSGGLICDGFEQLDSRFVVFHQSNGDLLTAKKRGIQLANGKWSTFLDAGGFLPSDEVLVNELSLAETIGSDILRFDVEIVTSLEKSILSTGENFIGEIRSSGQIISQIYQEKLFDYNILWDKLFRTSILKKASQFIPEAKDIVEGDFFLLFLVCFFSENFYSINTEPFYSFESGTNSENIHEFKKIVLKASLVKYLTEFVERQGELDNYESALENLTQNLVHAAVKRFSLLGGKDLSTEFDLLVNNNPIELVVDSLCQIYRQKTDVLADRIRKSAIIHCNTGKIRTVGIFYHKVYNGGVERGISHQIPMFLSLGYQVVLLTEEINKDLEYPIPDTVARIILPKEYGQGRAQALSDAIHEFEIDVVLHQAASSRFLLFDTILIKALKRNIIVLLHNLTTQPLLYPALNFKAKPHIYRLADALVVLNSMDLNFYRNFAVPAYYIPNHANINTKKGNENLKTENGKSVLWLGRLADMEKNYKEALVILAGVVKEVPDVVCYVLGSGKQEDDDYVIRYIDRNKLNDSIKFVGFTPDTSKYYSLATVHLITSSCECFPWTVIESKAYGLPLVLYEMPYLEILKDQRGYISVARHDKKAAISEIVELLNNDAKREQLAIEARRSFEEFEKHTLEQPVYWQDVLSDISHGIKKDEPISDEKVNVNLNLMFWDIAISFLQDGLNRKNNEIGRLKKEREKTRQSKLFVEKKLKSSLSREVALKQSISFRIGRTITWFPRKVRGGVRCFNRHGLIYTTKRLCWHVLHMK